MNTDTKNADAMVRELREEAKRQEGLLHVCDSTRNAFKAAEAGITTVRHGREGGRQWLK